MLTLYTIDGCVQCFKVKSILNEYNIIFEEKKLLEHQKAANELLTLIGEVRAPVLKSERFILSGKRLIHYLEKEEKINELKNSTSK